MGEWIRQERGPCRGSCPVYAVTLFSDGMVIREEKETIRISYVPAADVQYLLQRWKREALKQPWWKTNSLDTFSERKCFDVSDFSSAKVTVHLAENTWMLEHYQGCKQAPEILQKLEEQIDRVAGIKS